MSPVIAIFGANGRLGSAVAREAMRRGHRTITVTRSGRAGPHLPASIEVRAADAMNADEVTAAVRGADVVVNALNPPYPQWHRTALPMMRSVLNACEASGARHLFPGNVYAFGASMPSVLRPRTPERPTSRKGAIRQRMEAELRDAARTGRVRTTVLRAGDFFGGPVPGAWFDLAIAAKVERGTFTYPGPLDVPHPWAYLPDLADAFVDLAEHADERPDFDVLGFAGHTATGAEMRNAMERAMGHELRVRSLPWPIIRILGLVHPTSREIAELSYLWRTPHRIDGQALVEAIGVQQAAPLDQAVGHALEELGMRS